MKIRLLKFPWFVYGPVWLTPFVLMAPAWLLGKAIFWGTPILQFVPWSYTAWKSLASGSLPLWNPLLGMGAPLIANYQSALFYPPNWLLLLLAALAGAPLLAWGQALVIALHLAWAGTGMAKLAQRLGLGRPAQVVSGLAFGMCGYLVARSGFLSINAAVSWLPWILLGVLNIALRHPTRLLPQVLNSPADRIPEPPSRETAKKVWKPAGGSFALLAVALCMQLLAGHAQSTWYTLLLAGVWAIFLGITLRKNSPATSQGGMKQEAPRIERTGFLARTIPIYRMFRPIILLALAGLVAAALSAVQILPTAEYLLQSQRESGVDISVALDYSFSPWHFLTLVMPEFFGNPGRGNYAGYANYWESAVYIGLLPFLLAVRALVSALHKPSPLTTPAVENPDKKPRELQSDPTGTHSSGLFPLDGQAVGIPARPVCLFLGAVTLVSFVLALGKFTPLYPWLYRHVPTFDMFNGPARYALWAEFALALLAGYGMQGWRRPRGRALYWTRLGTAGAFAAILAASQAARFSAQVDPVQSNAVALAGIWALSAGLLSLLAPQENAKSHLLWSWAVVLILSADLLSAHMFLHPAASLELYRAPSPQADEIKALAGDGRLFLNAVDEYAIKFERFFLFNTFHSAEEWVNLRRAPLPNVTLLDGLPSANNFDPLVPRRYARWMKFLAGADPTTLERLLPRMAVSLVERVDESQPGGVRFTPMDSLNRVRWVPCALPAKNEEDAWQKVTSEPSTPDFARVTAILEGQTNLIQLACNSQAAVSVQKIYENPNRLEFQVVSSSSGFLVIADTFYPGWKAQVDGKPTPILPADYLFRAVAVPAGEHRIVFQYNPLSFQLGFLASFLTWSWFLTANLLRYISLLRKGLGT